MNLLMRKKERELESKLREATMRVEDYKRHMIRVQELNNKLMEKVKYHDDAEKELSDQNDAHRQNIYNYKLNLDSLMLENNQ